MTYDFSVDGANGGVVFIPYTRPEGSLVGHLYLSKKSGQQGTEISANINFDESRVVLGISDTAPLPGFYTVTVSIDGGPEIIVVTGRASTNEVVSTGEFLTKEQADALYTSQGRY